MRVLLLSRRCSGLVSFMASRRVGLVFVGGRNVFCSSYRAVRVVSSAVETARSSPVGVW